MSFEATFEHDPQPIHPLSDRLYHRQQDHDDQYDLGLARHRQQSIDEHDAIHHIHRPSASPAPGQPSPTWMPSSPLGIAPSPPFRPLVSYASSSSDLSDSPEPSLQDDMLPNMSLEEQDDDQPWASPESLPLVEPLASPSPSPPAPTPTHHASSSVPTLLRSDITYRNPDRIRRSSAKRASTQQRDQNGRFVKRRQE